MELESVKSSTVSKEVLRNLPTLPGVYKFFDEGGAVIYVGKSVNLKERVSSYFASNHERRRTKRLVSKIKALEYYVVETEFDALLLENSLIKKHKPRYNVLLKDAKSYPFICITQERFPRVMQIRNPLAKHGECFGPYTSVFMVRTLLNLFNRLFKLRTCKYNLSEANIKSRKIKPCLECHIGNCLAPCVAKQSEADYIQQIEQIKHILKGYLKPVKDYLKSEMFARSQKMEFEKAEELRKQLEILKNYESKATVVNSKLGDLDVFNIICDDKYAYVNMIRVAYGSVIQIHNAEIKIGLEDTIADVLLFAIIDFIYNKRLGISNAKELVLPFELKSDFGGYKITVPKIGDKKKLLDLSLKNLKYFKGECIRRRSYADKENRTERILKQMRKDLHLSELPTHIECFDNSNIQGTNPVSSCVVFKNAKPSKKDYRKFHVKTVKQIDDFASMYEVVYRRYSRLKNENQDKPQLVIIDGGKGQLSSAYRALCDLDLQDEIAIIGIAKRLEEIFFPGEKIPLYLDKNSESLKVIQHARNEAHRFGITFHRNKRSGNFVKSELENINGVGEKTIKKLLQTFKSVRNIKNASEIEISKVVGKKKANAIKNYFKLYEK